MPNILSVVRPRKNSRSNKNKDVFRSSKKAGPFRRLLSKPKKDAVADPLLPVEQAVTWTLSEDSVLPSGSAGEPLVRKEQPEQRTAGAFVFTEAEVMQNELNHIRALTDLQNSINQLREHTDQLVSKHERQLAKKDDEYVELMIVAAQKEEALIQVRAELTEKNKELETISVALLRAQHELFERAQQSWRSLFV